MKEMKIVFDSKFPVSAYGVINKLQTLIDKGFNVYGMVPYPNDLKSEEEEQIQEELIGKEKGIIVLLKKST